MSKVQNSYRRVILVHCDTSTRTRVIEAAHSLNLFSATSSTNSKIWIFLDGLTDDLLTQNFYEQLNLPPGVLALSLRSASINDAQALTSIVSLIGKTAAQVQSSRTKVVSSGSSGLKFSSTCWHSSVHNISSSRTDFSLLVYK